MEKIVISADEIAQTTHPADEPVVLSTKLPPPISRWAKACLSPLVLVLPILCVVSILMQIAVRGLPPRTRFAWASFFSTLLAVSGILTSVGGVIAFSVRPVPSVVSQGLSDLDNRTAFPALPADHDLTAEEVSAELKPLVVVITPSRRNWFSKSDEPSNMLGAGILLEATAQGYLIATARHVVDGELGKPAGTKVLVASTSGAWAVADVVARHQNLDLSLIWLPRRSGQAEFILPVSGIKMLKDGQTIYVIGHPQGLRFTLSTGIISRKDQDALQISAPVSPGNSGGPLFDTRGRLAGIVTSMIDKNQSPNSENLNFAVRTDALLETSGWTFSGEGRRYLTGFQQPQHTDSH
jgi:S1-C subfamily serine protease